MVLEDAGNNLASKIVSPHKSKHTKHCSFAIKLFSLFGHKFFSEFHNDVKIDLYIQINYFL